MMPRRRDRPVGGRSYLNGSRRGPGDHTPDVALVLVEAVRHRAARMRTTSAIAAGVGVRTENAAPYATDAGADVIVGRVDVPSSRGGRSILEPLDRVEDDLGPCGQDRWLTARSMRVVRRRE